MIGVRRTPKRRESSANKGADRFSKRALAHVESDRDRRVSQIAEEQGLNMAEAAAEYDRVRRKPDRYRDAAAYPDAPRVQWFLSRAARLRSVVYGSAVGTFVLACILLAGALVGMQTYPSMKTDPVVQGLDFFVLCVFALEVVGKVVAEGLAPWRYFVGAEWRWNNFDFFVVVLCLPMWGDSLGGGSVALLRLMRLARLAKLVKKIPQLQTIMMGLLGGFESIGYILLLLFLVFYLYGVSGFYLFGDNDPWHYGDMPRALLTLFRAATLEDWTDVMYLNIYGCAHYPFYAKRREETPRNAPYHCADSASQNVLGPLYWVSFTVISGMVMMSLFIGAVTMAMSASIDEMREEADAARKLAATSKSLKSLGLNDPSGAAPVEESRLAVLLEAAGAKATRALVAVGLREDQNHTLEEITQLLALPFDGIPLPDPRDRSFARPAVKHWYRFALACKGLAEDMRFQNFIMLCIVIAGVTVGMGTDPYWETNEGLARLDEVILYIFTFECALKVVAEFTKPLRYFKSNWNTFDLLIVIGSYALDSGMIAMLRMMRLLRVLKLVNSLPQLQVIVDALILGVGSIGYIGIILGLTFYLFAIVGVMLFQPNDPVHFESLHLAMLTLYRCSTLEDWTDVMYINVFGCDQYGYNSPADTKLCRHPKAWGALAVVYFVVFTIVAGLVLLTLFIGVVTTSMDVAQEKQKKGHDVAQSIADFIDEAKVAPGDVEVFMRVFSLLDLDDGGTIDEDELRIGLAAGGRDIPDWELRKLIDMSDMDDDGEIDRAEFLRFMCTVARQTKVRRDSTAQNLRRSSVLRWEEMLQPPQGAPPPSSLVSRALLAQPPGPSASDRVPAGGGECIGGGAAALPLVTDDAPADDAAPLMPSPTMSPRAERKSPQPEPRAERRAPPKPRELAPAPATKPKPKPKPNMWPGMTATAAAKFKGKQSVRRDAVKKAAEASRRWSALVMDQLADPENAADISAAVESARAEAATAQALVSSIEARRWASLAKAELSAAPEAAAAAAEATAAAKIALTAAQARFKALSAPASAVALLACAESDSSDSSGDEPPAPAAPARQKSGLAGFAAASALTRQQSKSAEKKKSGLAGFAAASALTRQRSKSAEKKKRPPDLPSIKSPVAVAKWRSQAARSTPSPTWAPDSGAAPSPDPDTALQPRATWTPPKATPPEATPPRPTSAKPKPASPLLSVAALAKLRSKSKARTTPEKAAAAPGGAAPAGAAALATLRSKARTTPEKAAAPAGDNAEDGGGPPGSGSKPAHQWPGMTVAMAVVKLKTPKSKSVIMLPGASDATPPKSSSKKKKKRKTKRSPGVSPGVQSEGSHVLAGAGADLFGFGGAAGSG